MNKNFQKGVISLVLSSMILTNTAFAASEIINKSETVYVLKKDDKITDKTVSVWLNSEGNIKGKDKSNLKNVKNLKTDEMIKNDSGYIYWDEDVKDIYYQGKSEKDLPVDVKIDYYTIVKFFNSISHWYNSLSLKSWEFFEVFRFVSKF